MVSHEKLKISDSDYATRIDLMTKVFGIDAAARYFEGLADSAKTAETYTALLHSFAGARLTEKAELLYEKMKESKLPLTALTYNEMMTLYISVGQVDKIPPVVEELKRQNVTPDIFTYNLWISSRASVLNINEVRRILDEMSICSGSDGCQTTYVNLVKIYIDVNRLENAGSSSLVEADKGITQREWITYDFLVILYAALGNKDKVDQIWKSLRMTNQKMTSRNFLCILSSFLILGRLNEVGEVIDQWKQSSVTEFDPSACNRLLAVFGDLGLSKNANDFEKLLIERNCSLPAQK